MELNGCFLLDLLMFMCDARHPWDGYSLESGTWWDGSGTLRDGSQEQPRPPICVQKECSQNLGISGVGRDL